MRILVVEDNSFNRDLIRIKIAGTNLPMPPKPEGMQTLPPPSSRPLDMTASWILSALPGCLLQRSETTGPPTPLSPSTNRA